MLKEIPIPNHSNDAHKKQLDAIIDALAGIRDALAILDRRITVLEKRNGVK